jgi:hypothetical protein
LDYVKDNLIARSIFDVIFKRTGEKVFTTTTVRELLFDGYKDPLISKWCSDGMKTFCDMLKIPERIGLFYQVSSNYNSTHNFLFLAEWHF